MNMLASGFTNFINGVFSNWQMLLFVIAAVLLLLAVLFRKFKTAAVLLTIAVVGIYIALITLLVVNALNWGKLDAIEFAVKWSPTIMFTTGVLITTLINAKRGLRKSLILWAHAIVIAAACITAYFLLVNMPAVDGFMLKAINTFMGSDGALQRALGAPAECTGLREVLVECLVKQFGGDFGIMLGASRAYLYTLADMIFHVAFAYVFYLIYLILDFIMYIIYLCCYSERKYRKKIQVKYSENKVDKRYSKHHVGGGVVGLVRGLIAGIISLSFLGSALYIVAGRGDGKLKDFDFGDDNYNELYAVYRSIERYGTSGIFKILNSISSPDSAPYYLFAADLIFSGELNDEDFGITENIVLREELSAYVEFARNTMELLLKYGGDEVREAVANGANGNTFDKVLSVMSNEAFRAEFNDLIDEFDTKTYIINFALSFVNAAIDNIDSMSFKNSVSPESREILKILFTKGYLSEYIPDEKVILLAGGDIQIFKEPPYLNMSKILNKNDIKVVYNVVVDLLGKNFSTTGDVLENVGSILSTIKELTILSDGTADEVNPVLGRLYCYAANRYLSEEGAEGVKYSDIYAENIEWVSEINSLIDVADNSVKLYKNISDSNNALDTAIDLFDKDSPDYEQNMQYYDGITKSVLSSRILGKALASGKTYSYIEKGLNSVFKEVYIPRDIVYESTFDENGELVSAGEAYNLLYAVGAIGKNGKLLPLIKNFNKDRDLDILISELTEALEEEDERGVKLSTYVKNSKLLRSVASAAIINLGENYAYVPTVARETVGGKPVNLIKQAEFDVLIDNLSKIADFALPLIKDANADRKEAIAEFVKEPVFDTLLNGSTVFEGTVALYLINELDDDETVVISHSLKTDLNGWVTQNGVKGELKNLLTALETADISIDEVIARELTKEKMVDSLVALSSESLQTCLKSQVFHYTLSNYLTDGETADFGGVKVIVPEAACSKLEDDSIPALVKKKEIDCVLQFVKELDLSSEAEISTVLVKLVQNKRLLADSFILSASVVRTLVDDPDVSEMLSLQTKFKEAAQVDKLKKFNSANPWKSEITLLIDALDDVMGISAAENFVFSEEKLNASLSEFLKDMNGSSQVVPSVTRLDVCYASEVVRGNITTRLDEVLLGSDIDENMLYGSKNVDGYYTETELESLSHVLNTFEIDVMNINADELVKKITDGLLSLNDPAEGYAGKTKLNMTYPSAIFSGILSSELDDVLVNMQDDDGEPMQMIDEKLLKEIKGGSLRYEEQLIADLINSLRAFGVKGFDDIKKLGVNEVRANIDKIDEICQSLIIRGIFTKQIQDNETFNVDHPLAYESDIRIVKTNEIESIVNVVEKIDDVEDTYFDTIELSLLNKNLFYESGEIKSYLLLRAVSDCIKSSNYLIVNRDLIDGYGCIDSGEFKLLTNAFIKLFGEGATVHSVQEAGGFDYPDGEKRAAAIQSEIVRAKLTMQFVDDNRLYGEYCVTGDNIKIFTDTRGERRGVISAYEMSRVFAVLDALTGGEDFVIPTINFETLKNWYTTQPDIFDLVFLSEIISFRISDVIVTQFGADYAGATEKTAYLLVGLLEKDKQVVDKTKVMEILDEFA